MNIRSYPKIYNLGHAELENLFECEKGHEVNLKFTNVEYAEA